MRYFFILNTILCSMLLWGVNGPAQAEPFTPTQKQSLTEMLGTQKAFWYIESSTFDILPALKRRGFSNYA